MYGVVDLSEIQMTPGRSLLDYNLLDVLDFETQIEDFEYYIRSMQPATVCSDIIHVTPSLHLSS